MATIRTTTGCWTCRIRRKKCDDVRPSCGPCCFRQLTCHGFGRKPAWMDSADNQRAEVERIKQSVSESYRSRRAFCVSKHQEAKQSRGVQTTRFKSEGHPSQPVENVKDHAQDIEKLQIGDYGRGTVSLPLSDPWPTTFGLSNSFGTSTNTLEALPSPYIETKPTSYPHLFHLDAPPAENEDDFAMIMYYLDNIFPLQFYFHQPSSSERGRGWLLSLLIRTKSSYFTALAFSSLHQIMFNYKDDAAKRNIATLYLDKYHSLALSELQEQLEALPSTSGPAHLKMGVEILACMMQFMSIEVFRATKLYQGWKEDWEVHLNAAGSLLAIIGTDLQTSGAPTPLSNPDGDEESSRLSSAVDLATGMLPLGEIAGLDFFMKVYIWSDVFRCTSIGLMPIDRDPFPYLAYLQEDRIRLDHIMGCKNWVMILLKEISNLETWKMDMKSRHCLSIFTLSHRAAVLEERLRVGLESAVREETILTTVEQECNLVTQIYAQSAITYLAIVVSGNFHLLPEIRSSVVKTLSNLKELPPHLLIRVSWAYCAAGCMADGVEKEEFRELLTSADKAGHPLGTLWNGLEIMEEFWNLREGSNILQDTDKCAWALAMDSLGIKVLLI